jgi:hypothetical protein
MQIALKKMLRQARCEWRVRIVQTLPCREHLALGFSIMTNRPRGGSVTPKSPQKLARRVPCQGLVGRLVKDQDTERPPSVIEGERTAPAPTDTGHCRTARAFSLCSAACSVNVRTALERSVLFRGLGVGSAEASLFSGHSSSPFDASPEAHATVCEWCSI